jgi:hypothetical protein
MLLRPVEQITSNTEGADAGRLYWKDHSVVEVAYGGQRFTVDQDGNFELPNELGEILARGPWWRALEFPGAAKPQIFEYGPGLGGRGGIGPTHGPNAP